MTLVELIRPLEDENEQRSSRIIRENEHLADVPALDNHPRPVAETAPLVSKDTQSREFPYSK